MSTVSAPRARCKPHTASHATFATILPRIETHARIVFRNVTCPQKRADFIAETVGLAWKWFRRLEERGKDATQFPSAIATLAARAVRSGRRVCGQMKAKDALNELTQQRKGFTVGKLPDRSTMEGNPLFDALKDNQHTPPDEQAAFRMDFPAWQGTRSERDRRLIEAMGMGEGTTRLADMFGMSPARVSQLRAQFKEDWDRFCGEPETR